MKPETMAMILILVLAVAVITDILRRRR